MENLELKIETKVDKKELENKLVLQENVTDEKVEESLNYDKLLPEEQKAIDEFVGKIDISNTNQILQFGEAAQTNISKFSDSVLQEVKTKNAGDVGTLLANLVTEIKEFDEATGEEPKGIFKVFSSAKSQLNKIVSKYNKVEKNIDVIEQTLEAHKLQMIKDMSTLDTMYEKNLEYFKDLSLYIIAGERKIKELKEVVLPELQRKASESNEQLDVQAVNDLSNTIERFERKIYDLKTTRIISIQMAPQIRLIQNNDSELINKIQSSLINTIPLWKNQIVIALGITNAKAALKSQQAVTDLTNEMLKKNSENLKQGTIQIAEEAQKAIVDVETLKKTNGDIIETLDKLIEIQENGKQKRVAAELELTKIEGELKQKLFEIRN